MNTIQVIFSAYGEDLNIAEFSKIIDMQPTRAAYEGEELRAGRPSKDTFWEYHFAVMETHFLSEVLDVVRNVLFSKGSLIADYMCGKQVECKIDVVVYLKGEILPALCIDSETIKLLSLLNADFDFDLYHAE